MTRDTERLTAALRRSVDVSGDQTWSDLPYSNTWANFLNGWATGQWFKDPMGVVHLRGLVRRAAGAPSDNEILATLPAGARPVIAEMFVAQHAGGTSRIDVNSDGTIRWRNESTPGVPQSYLSLSGITFRAG